MLEKEASLSYSKKDFTSALPAYRQLLAKDQLNPDFNFRYGHCLYEVANQNDAAKYFDLTIANQLPCDPLVYYYRGRIFQHQYFFQKAISAYHQYEKLSANQKDTYPITELIKQCERGVLELKNFQTLPFLSTKEVERNKFYTQYPFAEEGYSIYEAAEVLPKYNAKKGNVPIYCYRRAMKYRILALDDGSGQLDLYIQKKDAANNWAKLIKIEGEVNSSKNEAFGFYDEESQTLYFSSETNSIGGYDIFKAQLDLQTGKSSTLERLPYPYASPDDDLLFVMDRTRGQVYFSSNRAGQAGRCEIYSLALDQEKQTPFVFAGTFSNQNDNKQLKASLSFTDLNTETQFGPFLSDENGTYLIVLPEKGSFRLSIQLEGASKAYETTFVIPTLKENEQLKQVVRYELNEYGREKYTVINSIIPADLEKQVDLLAQAQLKWQAKEIKQVQFKSTAPSITERSPLLSQFAWVDSDTAALVNQLTDTLLAAEVSLENQVRLTEVLRKDFELKLAERERLISSGDVEALDQISQELAFIQTWLNINQAANIPNIEILGKIQQTNEKLAAWQHAGQQDSILNYLESVGGELSKYLQIAAFDGESALQIEQYKAQMALQEQAKALQLEKQNRLKTQDQLKVQEKNLALQSKKEQEATQKRIDQLKQQLALSDLNIDILSSKLQKQEVYVATFEQATQKEIYLSQSEQQNLPDIDLSMSMEELLSQYAQQEVLIKSIKEGSNPISEKKGEQLAQEEITLNSEDQAKEESTSNAEKRANTNIETIEKLAAVSRQLNEEEGQLIETDIPSVSISAQELGELAQAIELPKASKLTETELASEQWLAYMKYLEARDTMERYKEQISNLNEQIKNLEVSYLETPTDEVQQALLEKAEAQQVAIEQLKNIQHGLLKQPLQAEFEALFEMGYLPPYELAVNNESATLESGYNPLPEGQMASFKVAQQAPGSSIPIGVPCAQGLVFRVQVGAFRKPIPAGKFTEFSPVDGRVLANGLTVVMAGYFRSSTDAINQRNVIRRLGYADAFVVAYNGCERLNYAAAVQLEGSNKGTNTQQVRKSVFETPGEGLYYTVQVGVYNRPLLSEKQLGLPELIEAQTAKGQYRYASGRFAQLAAAKERQRLAVQKGITDAFIVAYYQGKRISLAEAKTLMAQGVQMDTQTTKPKDLTPKPSALPLQTVPVLPAKKALQAAPTFVRYEQTCSDCPARLAALNRAGIFIYQTENGILSSAQINTDELTALQRYLLRGMKINTQTLNGPFKTLTIDEGKMNGAQMDWLLRQGSPYMFTQASKESILISVEIK